MQFAKIFFLQALGRMAGIGFLAIILLFWPAWASAQTTETFTASTTWTAPAGVTSVTVECWGAGGSGGSSGTNAYAGGGGGGAYSRSINIAVVPGNNYTITVGLAGAAPGKNAAGNAGGDTWFSNISTVLAKGGSGGAASSTGGAGGAGGAASAGVGNDATFSGGDGATQTGSSGGGGGSGAGSAADGTPASGSSGGIAPSGGGNGGNGNSNADGGAGSAPGGAGGGAGDRNNLGGAGADGQVKITYTVSNDNCPTSTSVTPNSIQTLCEGDASNQLTASVTTSGGNGTPSLLYQWYFNTTNSNTVSGATLINGATSSTYTPLSTASEIGNRWYFCVGYATDNNCSQSNATQSLASNAVQVTVNPQPGAVTVSGGGTFCGSATLTASGGTGGTIYYQGTTSGGTSTATPSSSQLVTASGTYYFRAMNAGCWGPEGSATVTINPEPAATTVSGGGSFCGSTTITASGGAGGTIYFQGTTSNGTSTASPSSSEIITSSGTYYFRSLSAAGCWGPQGSATVTINPEPAATTVSGGGTFCGNTTITASGGTGGTIYFQGTTSGGTSIANPSTSESITSTGTYYFRARSAAGCWGPEGSVAVTITPGPTITLGSDPIVCQGTTTADLTYSATTGSPNRYSINYDATAEGQGFTDVGFTPLTGSPIGLTVPAGATPATYNFTITVRNNTTGCESGAYPKTITVDPPAPATPGSISGLTSVNPSTPGLTYSISAVTYATSYNWTVPSGWSITAGQGTTSITVTSGTTGGNISVTASNSCGTSSASLLAVSISNDNCPESTSVSPADPQSVCQDDPTNQLTASVTLSGGTGTPTVLYQWYYNTSNSNTIAGATKISGATAADYTPPSSTAGTRYYFCVGYATDNNCGQTDATQSLASNTVEVTINTAPATPGTISGPASVNPSTSGLAYSISSVPTATSYTWSVPSGWTINSGQGTTSISATSGLAGENGNITVTASNACGTSAASSLAVTVVATAVKPTITLGTFPTICAGTTTADLPYTATTSSPDLYSIDYNTTSNAAGFVDVVDATLTSSPIVLTVPDSPPPANGRYYAFLTVKNSSSGLSSITYTFYITVISTPATPATIYGYTTVAENTPQNFSAAFVSGATTYTWTVPTGWVITAGQGTRDLTATSGNAGQDGNITVTAGNTCGTSAPATLAVASVVPVDHITYGCNSCHLFHNSGGVALTNTAGNANLCMTCHVTTGAASAKALSNGDIAIPGTSGTSHAWNVAAVNPTRETAAPSNPQMLARLDDAGNIVCSTCHNQHNSNTNPSYLRVDNTGDAMCKDCHSPRNVGKYTANPSLNKGSHPVGLDYTGTGDFKATPTGSVTLPNGKIECSSCHQTHYATTTDGNLLRQAGDNTLCTSCHTLGTHNNMNCLDCHIVHNTNKSNLYMIKDNIATPNSGNKAVVFTALTGSNSFADGNATYDGICEVCHTSTAHFMNDGNATDQLHLSIGGAAGLNCTSCHPHSANFAPAGGNCTDCHISNFPGWGTTDGHFAHTDKYSYACSTCHNGHGSGGSLEGSHPSGGSANVVFDPNGLATRNGQDGNNPAFNGTTCSNIYCHSTGTTSNRFSEGIAVWNASGSTTAITYFTTPDWSTGSITQCVACHEGPATMPAAPNYTIVEGNNTGVVTLTSEYPNTGAHGSNTGAHNSPDQLIILTEGGTYGNALPHSWPKVQCFWCHNNDSGAASGEPKFQGTYGTPRHVDGRTWYYPFWYGYGGGCEKTSGGQAPAYYLMDTEAECNALGSGYVWHPAPADPEKGPSMVPGLGYSWVGPTNEHCGNGKNCW